MIQTLAEYDKELFLLLNGAHSAASDVLMWWLSDTKIWIPLYVFFIYLIIKNYKKDSVWILFFLALVILAADQFASGLCKPLFERLRPSHEPSLEGLVHLVADRNGNLYRGGRFGFISSHAANTFGLAAYLFLLFRNPYPSFVWIFVWAAAVSYSRIALGVHYPADIVLGAAAGAFFGWAGYYGLQKTLAYSKTKKNV